MKESVKEIPQEYKDSPLGIIPQDWEVKRLGEIGKFEKGFGVPKDKILSDGLPCVTYGELYTKYNVEFNDTYSHISEETSEYSKSVNNGCILFAGSGETPEDIGKCAAYCGFDKCYVGGDIIIFIPNESFDNVFLSYILNSTIGGRQRYKMAQGHSVVHIYSHNLNDIQILHPTLKIQQKIVELLRTWDLAIEKQTLKIQKLELRKKGLMQQLLTGKKRLPGFVEDWVVTKIEDMGTVLTGNTPSMKNAEFYGGSFCWATAVDFDNKYICDTKIKLTEIGKEYARIAPPNSVLVTCIASIGKNAITKVYTGFNQQINAIIPNSKNSAEFIYYMVSNATDILMKYAGSGAVPILNKDNFVNIRFRMPEFDEQTAIANILSEADKEITLEKNKLSKLQLEKKGLMQQLLTGKIIIN
ncbi:MAG: restriction endonuclease subunit S [Paludibacteraceae bacterium]|nr:restriction endonuclease subunit S [Paludibacteraceae bacterium]